MKCGSSLGEFFVHIQGGDFAWDVARTARIMSFAVFVHAPFLHFFHRRLDAVFGTVRGMSTTAKKVFVDQVLVTPPFFAFFLSYDTLLAGKGLQGVQERLTRSWWPLLQDCWKLWPFAHIITFNLPFQWRVLFCDIVRVYFGTVMSLRANEVVTTPAGTELPLKRSEDQVREKR